MYALYDYRCEDCDVIEERLEKRGTDTVICSYCEGTAYKIFTPPKAVHGDNPAWLRSTLEIVDKTSDKPATRAFLQDPNRKNYKAWMKERGIRPLEDGEKIRKPPDSIDVRKHTEEIMKLRYNRRRIEI